jgi:hypothetical protein
MILIMLIIFYILYISSLFWKLTVKNYSSLRVQKSIQEHIKFLLLFVQLLNSTSQSQAFNKSCVVCDVCMCVCVYACAHAPASTVYV